MEEEVQEEVEEVEEVEEEEEEEEEEEWEEEEDEDDDDESFYDDPNDVDYQPDVCIPRPRRPPGRPSANSVSTTCETLL